MGCLAVVWLWACHEGSARILHAQVQKLEAELQQAQQSTAAEVSWPPMIVPDCCHMGFSVMICQLGCMGNQNEQLQ